MEKVYQNGKVSGGQWAHRMVNGGEVLVIEYRHGHVSCLAWSMTILLS